MADCISCGDTYPPERQVLGYNTCMSCGDFAARQVQWCTAPLNKSNYVVITNKAELAMLNPKRTGGC
jgi:hypothetical protein